MERDGSWLYVQYSDNWADEMDITGGQIFTKTEWDAYRKAARKVFKDNGGYTFYMGTNQYIEYSSYEDFKNCFEIKKLSIEEVHMLERLGLDCMGIFPENIGEGEDEDMGDTDSWV